MRTVFHPVSQHMAGQIMKVKELVDVEEVEEALSKEQFKSLRTPDAGFYVEKKAGSNGGMATSSAA
jgi:large subunit ribosomal protein L30